MTACNCTSGDVSSSIVDVKRSLSGDCDPVSGRCYCQQNVIGVNCDRCAVDSYNFSVSTGCQLCQCHGVGSRSDTCNNVSNALIIIIIIIIYIFI